MGGGLLLNKFPLSMPSVPCAYAIYFGTDNANKKIGGGGQMSKKIIVYITPLVMVWLNFHIFNIGLSSSPTPS